MTRIIALHKCLRSMSYADLDRYIQSRVARLIRKSGRLYVEFATK